jgi:1,4-dihydroxy-2-naphthoate polyprenyltransferase
VPGLRRVLAGSTGRDLIPVLRDTALGLLVWSAATGLGLALT